MVKLNQCINFTLNIAYRFLSRLAVKLLALTLQFCYLLMMILMIMRRFVITMMQEVWEISLCGHSVGDTVITNKQSTQLLTTSTCWQTARLQFLLFLHRWRHVGSGLMTLDASGHSLSIGRPARYSVNQITRNRVWLYSFSNAWTTMHIFLHISVLIQISIFWYFSYFCLLYMSLSSLSTSEWWLIHIPCVVRQENVEPEYCCSVVFWCRKIQ